MPLSDTDIDNLLAKAMMHIIETAAKDGLITDDEEKLISNLDLTMEYFKKSLIAAVEDGRISRDEENQLQRIKDHILSESFEIANQDDHLSKDEMNLLISVMLSLQVPKSDD